MREAYITTGLPVISHLRKQIYHSAQSAARGRPRAQLTLQSPEFYTVKKPRLTLGGGGGLGVDWGAGNHQKRRRRTICRQRGSPPRIAAGVHAGDFLIYSLFFLLYSLIEKGPRSNRDPSDIIPYPFSCRPSAALFSRNRRILQAPFPRRLRGGDRAYRRLCSRRCGLRKTEPFRRRA